MNAQLLESWGVLPVVTPLEGASTVHLVAGLTRGGMTAKDTTLRSETALESIRAVRVEYHDILIAGARRDEHGTGGNHVSGTIVVAAGVAIASRGEAP